MKKTSIGIIKCGQWLTYCLSIGYTEDQLEALEKIFWKFKDGNGNLKR